MIQLSKRNEYGLWTLPRLVEHDRVSGELCFNRRALPQMSQRIVFGRGTASKCMGNAIRDLSSQSAALVVVGASSSASPQVSPIIEMLRSTDDSGERNIHTLEVHGRADHEIVRAGIDATRRIEPAVVIAMGGGTTLDVGKAVAALAFQEGGTDIASFQLKEKAIDQRRVLPWMAVPTTSGTGSESSNNAVIELGEEKRSIRPIPPPSMIIADPSLTDSLPLRPTVVSGVDALSQALEVLTHADASKEVQAVALAAVLSLAEGLSGLREATAGLSEDNVDAQAAGKTRNGLQLIDISTDIRNSLCWGSLLMGIAFAHAHLGLPHALVHHCMKYGMLHGNMVGILLAPGLGVQADADTETAARLNLAEAGLLAIEQGGGTELVLEGETEKSNWHQPKPSRLVSWLRGIVSELFTLVGLPASLRDAGLTHSDLEWIAESEGLRGASFGIPTRLATHGELMEVLEKAFSVESLDQ